MPDNLKTNSYENAYSFKVVYRSNQSFLNDSKKNNNYTSKTMNIFIFFGMLFSTSHVFLAQYVLFRIRIKNVVKFQRQRRHVTIYDTKTITINLESREKKTVNFSDYLPAIYTIWLLLQHRQNFRKHFFLSVMKLQYSLVSIFPCSGS